jgi:transcriptional regulator with XRE-family HTH domain
MTTRDDQNRLRDLGATIRHCREATGLTQAELAVRAVIDRSYLCGIESGKRSPTVLVLMRIAQCLGPPPAALLGGGTA